LGGGGDGSAVKGNFEKKYVLVEQNGTVAEEKKFNSEIAEC
jgi:hypothetical protein